MVRQHWRTAGASVDVDGGVHTMKPYTKVEWFDGRGKRQTGYFVGLVRHTVKHKGAQMAYVRKGDNRRMSKVKYFDLCEGWSNE